VRRIEALTGPAAVERLRERDRSLRAIETGTRVSADRVLALVSELREKASASATANHTVAIDIDALAAAARDVGGALVLTQTVEVADGKALLDVVDRLKGKLSEAAIVLGAAVDGRVQLVASVPPSLVQRGVKAGVIVKAAAEILGGGGGGRDTLAQAGGRHPEKLEEALTLARKTIESALAG
jgi:alanyl-tRNA synthetase